MLSHIAWNSSATVKSQQKNITSVICYLKKLISTFVNCSVASAVILHPEELW